MNSVSKRILRIDRMMNRVIQIGGLSVILTVLGIFLFILWQIFPLFQKAKVSSSTSVHVGIDDFTVIGTDEWAELPFFLNLKGSFFFVDLKKSGKSFHLEPDWPDAPPTITTLRYRQDAQKVIFGTQDGQWIDVEVLYKPDFNKNGERKIQVKLNPDKHFLKLGERNAPIVSIDAQDYETRKMVAGIQKTDEGHKLHALLLRRKVSLLGQSQLKVDQSYDLSNSIEGHPEKVLINASADAITVLTREGAVHYVVFQNGVFTLQQTFYPFGENPETPIASMDFLLGDASLCFTDTTGQNLIYSLYHLPESGKLEYGLTKTFPPLKGGGSIIFSASQRNKAFLIGNKEEVSLRFSTTESIRWNKPLEYIPRSAVISGKYEHIFIADTAGNLHSIELNDPHPEAGLKAFFGKIWYEGQPEPQYSWQSTGATDTFEPKLSLVPLIFGSIKGTLYALIFAVPIAIMAAIYTSQFLKPRLRRIVKPSMEIMASLPSVVLGFLAALWLAPIIEDQIPSILLMIILIPLVAVIMGRLWIFLPQRARSWVSSGNEFIIFLPAILIVGYLCLQGGGLLEQLLFTVQDPETGAVIADFRQWWPQFTGTPFEQRNSLVVGFMMGFAVIPIIFTISEDSLSQVPASLVSGSLALGASRWQTAARIVVPSALPGIFSAFMIGLGRAVGETMIVVMATGNTPIMDLNIFSGMRTLSANIAVELPEAPHHGTLYRTLFLGAMVLFLITFFVNTLAELMRHRLRKKYQGLA